MSTIYDYPLYNNGFVPIKLQYIAAITQIICDADEFVFNIILTVGPTIRISRPMETPIPNKGTFLPEFAEQRAKLVTAWKENENLTNK
jgi:hypothetical protein